MYGKLFQSTFTGSLYGKDSDIFAVWCYVIAHTVNSVVELNPNLLAPMFHSTPERMREVIDYLCQPDPDSRNTAHDGRRLVREGSFQYFVPSHEHYRKMQSMEDRREYNRVKQQEYRAKRGQVVSMPEPEEDAVDAAYIVAREVMMQTGAAGNNVLLALSDVAKPLLRTMSVEDVINKMVSRRKEYEAAKPKLKYSFSSVQKFFESGEWDKPEGWPWKDGHKPQQTMTGRRIG